jgi:hypothetical protein
MDCNFKLKFSKSDVSGKLVNNLLLGDNDIIKPDLSLSQKANSRNRKTKNPDFGAILGTLASLR